MARCHRRSLLSTVRDDVLFRLVWSLFQLNPEICSIVLDPSKRRVEADSELLHRVAVDGLRIACGFSPSETVVPDSGLFDQALEVDALSLILAVRLWGEYREYDWNVDVPTMRARLGAIPIARTRKALTSLMEAGTEADASLS